MITTAGEVEVQASILPSPKKPTNKTMNHLISKRNPFVLLESNFLKPLRKVSKTVDMSSNVNSLIKSVTAVTTSRTALKPTSFLCENNSKFITSTPYLEKDHSLDNFAPTSDGTLPSIINNKEQSTPVLSGGALPIAVMVPAVDSFISEEILEASSSDDVADKFLCGLSPFTKGDQGLTPSSMKSNRHTTENLTATNYSCPFLDATSAASLVAMSQKTDCSNRTAQSFAQSFMHGNPVSTCADIVPISTKSPITSSCSEVCSKVSATNVSVSKSVSAVASIVSTADTVVSAHEATGTAISCVDVPDVAFIVTVPMETELLTNFSTSPVSSCISTAVCTPQDPMNDIAAVCPLPDPIKEIAGVSNALDAIPEPKKSAEGELLRVLAQSITILADGADNKANTQQRNSSTEVLTQTLKEFITNKDPSVLRTFCDKLSQG